MRRRVRGTVKSNKMEKTISVVSERRVKHPRYGKYVRRHSTYKVHDANNDAQLGDVVEIEESRPLSKTKSWRLVRVLKRGGEFGKLTAQELDATIEESSAQSPAPQQQDQESLS